MRALSLLDKSKLAVVIIDLQKGYCDPASDCAVKLGFDVSQSEALCHKVDAWLPCLRAVLPADRILWVQMEESEHMAPNMHYGTPVDDSQAPDHFIPLCLRGTPGHDFHIVKPAKGEPVFQKLHYSVFHAQEFRTYLEKNSITQLAFLGVVGSRCVNASVIAASTMGYECILLEDMIAAPIQQQDEMKHHVFVTTLFYALPLTAKTFIKALEAA